METDILNKLGPLKGLVGTWQGQKGHDRAPSPTRDVEETPFREELEFELLNPVDNHDQWLYGLRYKTMAWPKGDESPFHEELGYWLWDPNLEHVMRCFLIPRGVTVIAGGKVKADAKEFSLEANLGSQTYGICSNPFLDKEFQTVKYSLTVKILGENEFSYEEDTLLKIKGKDELFHHKDSNLLTRLSS